MCEEHIFQTGVPDGDHVQLMTLLRLKVSPEDLVLMLGIEGGIGYARAHGKSSAPGATVHSHLLCQFQSD